MPPMPITLSAKKKLRADARKQKVNQKVETAFKLAIKNFKKNPSEESLKQAYSALDIAAKKAVIPKKRAARKKSRLAILVTNKPVRSIKKAGVQHKVKKQSGHKKP